MKKYTTPLAEEYALISSSILELSGPTGGSDGTTGDHGQAKEEIIIPDDIDEKFGW